MDSENKLIKRSPVREVDQYKHTEGRIYWIKRARKVIERQLGIKKTNRFSAKFLVLFVVAVGEVPLLKKWVS